MSFPRLRQNHFNFPRLLFLLCLPPRFIEKEGRYIGKDLKQNLQPDGTGNPWILGDKADSDAGENNGNENSSGPDAPKHGSSSNADNGCIKVIGFKQVGFQKIDF